MPPKHKCRTQDSGKNKKGKRTGGPLRRTGIAAECWDEFVGESRLVIPENVLTMNKTLLQRYRALRVSNESAPTRELAKQIVNETVEVWNKARVPVRDGKTCIDCVVSLIEKWKTFSKYPKDRNHPDSDDFKQQLNELFDLAPKPRYRVSIKEQLEHVKEIMKSTGKKRTRGLAQIFDWERDFKF